MLNIGMVHQHFKLVSNFTVTENIVLGLEPKKRLGGILPVVDIKGTDAKIAALVGKVRPGGGPAGEDRGFDRLGAAAREILKMLYREAEIMIFDEPTAMLTPQEIESLLQVIRSLRDGGKTIILITHKLEEIKQVADRCAIMCRGKLTAVCDVATTSTHEMAYRMVGREVAEETEKDPAQLRQRGAARAGADRQKRERVPRVKNVSFSIRGGEIFAVAGVSGNGQEELADAIAGMMDVSSGTVSLDGEDITHTPVRERNEKGMAYIPADRQSTGMIMDFTLSENLLLKSYYRPPYCVRGRLHRDAFDKKSGELIKAYDIRSGQGAATVVRSMSAATSRRPSSRASWTRTRS